MQNQYSAAVLLGLIAFRADVAVLGFLIVSCVSAIYAEFHFRKTSRNKLSNLKIEPSNIQDDNLRYSILSFSKPFFIWGFFAWAHQSSDKWALLTFNGADTVGAYAVISQFAIYPLVFVSAFLSNFLIPIAYERAGGLQSEVSINSGKRILTGMVIVYLTGVVLLVSIFYFFHHQLILFISNEKYVQLSHLLPLLTCAWSLYYLGIVMSSFGFLLNKPNVYLAPILVSGILTTVTTFIFAYKFSMLGVIWALCITGFFYAVWCFLIAKRLITSRCMPNIKS